MDVSYQNTINFKYLVIRVKNQKQTYQTRMLGYNHFEHLLSVKVNQENNCCCLKYDISSMPSLASIWEKRSIPFWEIKKLVLELQSALEEAERFMLNPDGILLEPTYIYTYDSFMLKFCYIPNYSCDFRHSLQKLFRYILERVDHQDKQSVMLAYELYRICLTDNFTFKDYIQLLVEMRAEEAAEDVILKEEIVPQSLAADDLEQRSWIKQLPNLNIQTVGSILAAVILIGFLIVK